MANFGKECLKPGQAVSLMAEYSGSEVGNTGKFTYIYINTGSAIRFVNSQTQEADSLSADIQRAIDIIPNIAEQTSFPFA